MELLESVYVTIVGPFWGEGEIVKLHSYDVPMYSCTYVTLVSESTLIPI